LRDKIRSFFSFISESIWDLSPNSPIAFIVYLLLITVICVFLIFYFAKKSKKTKQKTAATKKEVTLDNLLEIANNSKSSTSDLLSALILFNEKFVVAQDKEKSLQFFEKILNHKNRQKKLFDYFHGSILPKNITFKDELDKLEKKALNK
jgi:Na+/melibiose symporter-like transporter